MARLLREPGAPLATAPAEPVMRLTWRRLLILAAVGLLGGLLFAWSGLLNVGASTGHWAITDWFLHYAMRKSVETHAGGIAAPPLDDPALVHRGAGHYASGCAPCHGAPGQPRSAIALAMTPPPPFLPEKIPEWQPNELFWIVRHGVKFTGMPAWAALARTDEVWAMTAFLLQLPDMQPDAYRALALGELAENYDAGLEGLADPFEPVLAECARCHGRDGEGRGVGAFPILAGQSEAYLFASLQAYARGQRHSGIMQPAAVPLDDAQMRRLARHYAQAGAAASEEEGEGPGAADRAPRRAGRRHSRLRLLPRAAGRPLPRLSGPARPDAGLPRPAAAPVPRRRPRRHPLRPHHGDDRAAPER